jgi:N-acetylglucosaminyl-diphospho-decaprenol L-rhamnosyltransferase
MSNCIWVIIVNYRTGGLVVDCLHSLADQIADYPTSHVVVIDNASGDGSVGMLENAIENEQWHSWATIIAMERNGGFAFGNNAGILAALASEIPPEFLLLLNPDTVAKPGALATLVNFMNGHPTVGIAGSLIENLDGGIECSAHVFPSPFSEFDQGLRLGLVSRWLKRFVVSPPIRHVAHECDWVSGACMMIRREVLNSVGLMDDDYFLYFEEVDYCRLAKMEYWSVWYVPEARVLHMEGASTGVRDRSKRRAGYWYDSRRRYFTKHYGVAGLLLADFLWVLGRSGYLLRRIVTPLSPRKYCDPKGYAIDLLWGDFKALLDGTLWNVPRAVSCKSSWQART